MQAPRSDVRFSVLIPTYNAEKFINQAIESVLEQTRVAECEILVIDDGSRDRTRELVASYDAPVRLLEQSRTCGTAAARNLGLRWARGEIVILLDHDDELHPLFVERVADVFERRSDVGIVFTDVYRFDERTKRVLPLTLQELHPLPRSLDLPALLRTNYISARAATRRDIVISAGGFDEDLSRLDDYDLWIRLLAGGYSAVGIPEPLAYYRLRQDRQSADELVMADLTERTLRKALRRLPLDDQARRACKLAIAAVRERAYLSRGVRAIEARAWEEAARNFRDAWEWSPLRWRGFRIAFFMVKALLRLTPVARRACDTGTAEAMRKAPPAGAGPTRTARKLIRRLRSRGGWHARLNSRRVPTLLGRI